ncbi:KilA-N domain-containing protein [Benzoatithermus flavus]|uniref:KilA-N domain-containing protein n=1 Tax=Benzoatithermus flavus TaxID=3108223 RepID=UPI003AAAAD4B
MRLCRSCLLRRNKRPDGWFNMTKAAQHFGKRVPEFMRLPSTVEYIAALREAVGKSHPLTETVVGKGKPQGIWAHPQGSADP